MPESPLPELDKKEFEFRLLMFVALSVEAEKWGSMIKGRVNFDFKFRLNQYLASSRSLQHFCKPYLDQDHFEDTSEVFSMLIEMICRRPPEERQRMITFLKKTLQTSTPT